MESLIIGEKTMFTDIGPDVLRKLHERAILVTSPNPQPYLSAPLTLPHSDIEVFFDFETDPMRDFCYLHGMLERRGGDNATERFDAFFADDLSASAEHDAFAAAWAYLRNDQQRSSISIRNTSERSGGSCSRNIPMSAPLTKSRLCSIRLGRSISTTMLFRKRRCGPPVIIRSRHWPSFSASNGVTTNPSGAASIEWFDQWVRTGDQAIRQRIIDYNEDDCRATRVLLDGIRGLADTMTGNSERAASTDVFTEPRYVWLFQCSNRTALHAATLDAKAGNLPKDVCRDGKWMMNGQLVVGPHTTRGTGIDIVALRTGIGNDGYYLWDADAEPLPDTLRLMR